jgi:hypothetical protein
MSHNLESDRKINLSEKQILTPYAWLRQEVSKLTKGVSIDSPQFKALDDYTDLQFGALIYFQDSDEIKGEIQQRKEESQDYKIAYDQISAIAKRYEDKFVRTSMTPDLDQDLLYVDLFRIKELEKDIKTEQSQTLPNK